MATDISPSISEEESMRRKLLREQHHAEDRKQALEGFCHTLVCGLKKFWNNLLICVSTGCILWGVISYRSEIQNTIIQTIDKATTKLEASSISHAPLNDEKEVNEITK
jgi:hypothetical protein